MSGSLAIRPVLHSLNLKIAEMPKTRFVHWMDLDAVALVSGLKCRRVDHDVTIARDAVVAAAAAVDAIDTGLVRHDDPARVPAVCPVSVEVGPIQGIATEGCKARKKKSEGQRERFFFSFEYTADRTVFIF